MAFRQAEPSHHRATDRRHPRRGWFPCSPAIISVDSMAAATSWPAGHQRSTGRELVLKCSDGARPRRSGSNAARNAMRVSQSIQRIGFRKWYERELLRSHANLVLLVMSTLALLGCAE